jgi:hypothetical protein
LWIAAAGVRFHAAAFHSQSLKACATAENVSEDERRSQALTRQLDDQVRDLLNIHGLHQVGIEAGGLRALAVVLLSVSSYRDEPR